MNETSEPDEPVTETAETVARTRDKSTDSTDLAWSLDTEGTPPHDHRWRGPVTSAALVTLLCVIVAVVTWFAITLYHQNDSRPTASAPSSSAGPAPAPAPATPGPAPTPSAPPPVTVTVPAPQEFDPADDQRLVDSLLSAPVFTGSDPAQLKASAHFACRLLRQGVPASQVTRDVAARANTDLMRASLVVAMAQSVYPHSCE